MEDQPFSTDRRRSEASEIITSGHVWTAVWYVAWPTAVNTFIQTAYMIVNRMFLGRVPDGAAQALAAVGIGGSVLMIQFAVTLGLSVGTSALVSRFLGARSYEDADDTTRQSLVLSVISAILTSIPLIALSHEIARAVGAQGRVIGLAGDYVVIVAYSSIPLFLYATITSVLRSAGDVRSPLYVGAVVLSINVLFDWLLIFGIGPFPQLGVRGAAIATGISRVVGMVLIFVSLRRSVLGNALSNMHVHLGWSMRIIRIGWPAALQNLIWTTAYAGFIRVLAFLPNATPAQAAVTVAITIESMAVMPGIAYSIAAAPLVGQNLGAGKPDRAEHSAWVATGQAAAIMFAVAVMFFVIPKQLALMFTDKTSVVPLIVSYLRINAVSEPFLALAMVLRGALQGAGETRIPAWIAFITNWAIRLPLAWLFAVHLGYGPPGAWAAMCSTTILSGLLVLAWFVWGNWRTLQV